MNLWMIKFDNYFLVFHLQCKPRVLLDFASKNPQIMVASNANNHPRWPPYPRRCRCIYNDGPTHHSSQLLPPSYTHSINSRRCWHSVVTSPRTNRVGFYPHRIFSLNNSTTFVHPVFGGILEKRKSEREGERELSRKKRCISFQSTTRK